MWLLCTSSRRRWGWSRHFQLFSQCNDWVAYSRNKGLLIHPLSKVHIVTLTGLSVSQLSSIFSSSCEWQLSGTQEPSALTRVNTVLVSPCSFPTMVDVGITVSPTTNSSFWISWYLDSSMFQICFGSVILWHYSLLWILIKETSLLPLGWYILLDLQTGCALSLF